jgi:hypothetical protein
VGFVVIEKGEKEPKKNPSNFATIERGQIEPTNHKGGLYQHRGEKRNQNNPRGSIVPKSRKMNKKTLGGGGGGGL